MSSFASNGFSSTPVKKSRNREKDFHKLGPWDLDVGVLSDDEDTFSLLSPIYHDSFDSGENIKLIKSSQLSQSSKQSPPKRIMNTIDRCELPKTPSDQMLSSTVPEKTPALLSAWEQWLLNKAKEDRIKLEKKAEEERLLQEKKKQQEKDHEQKVTMINQRIEEWLKLKREREKHEQDVKQSKEQEALMQMQKQRETELKAQEKYKEWLQKKNQEKAEKEKKQKEEAVLKEEQKKERRRRAEEKFKEWLSQANTKNAVNPKSTCQGPYRKTYPSPSFYNPIPWKPIHIPPETVTKTTDRKAQRQPKGQRSLSSNSRQRNLDYAARLQERLL